MQRARDDSVVHVKRDAMKKLTVGRSAASIGFILHDDGSGTVIYGAQPSARFATFAELLELHGLTPDDLERRPPS
jgi:hypothetical protein